MMIGIPEASAAIGGIKAAFGIAQGMAALKSETEINLAIINIQRTLLDAQNAALTDKELIGELRQRVSHLEMQLADRGAWETEKARYALTESCWAHSPMIFDQRRLAMRRLIAFV